MSRSARKIVVHGSASDLARAAAAGIAGHLRASVDATGVFTLVLAGGSTPRELHRELVERHADLPWNAVHFYFGDERCVPPDHLDSNYRMAHETLLSRLRVRREFVHRLPAESDDPAAAAAAYEHDLRSVLRRQGRGGPDLAVLGLGADGHTASLFPGSPALTVKDRWIVATQAPPGVSPRGRLTMTFPALAASSHVVFLVSGEAKRDALRAALNGDDPPPAGRVTARESVTWHVDAAAAPPG